MKRQLSLLIKPASSACNLKCAYCFYAEVSQSREKKDYGRMDLVTLEELVKKACEYADDFISFSFQGGEPLLAGLDFFTRFAELEQKYKKSGLEVSNSIQTNGTLIDEGWAEYFKKNNFLVGVSLDGIEKVHDMDRVDAAGKGTFNRVIEKIEVLKEHGVPFNILSVVTGQNYRFIERTYTFFKSQGFDFLQFISCIDDSCKHSLRPRQLQFFLNTLFDLWFSDFTKGNYISIRAFDNYINMLKGRMPESCAYRGTCGVYYVVEANGTLFPCDFYCTDSWRITNIKETDFFELQNNTVSKKFIEQSQLLSSRCKSCKFHFICRGGCKRDREPGLSNNRYCEAYYNFFEYTLDRMKYIAANLR